MTEQISALRLGASLYVPATRSDLAAIANGHRHPFLKSVILCTEDSILAEQVDAALVNLAECLTKLEDGRPLVFIRPRNIEVLGRILAMKGIERIDGFVLPKTTPDSMIACATLVPPRFMLMPTLETLDVFDATALRDLRTVLSGPGLKNRILALRIGGNDILNLLGIRRRAGKTIYDTAAGPVMAALVAAFRPFGFALTAPVFEDFGDLATLREEVSRDLDHGLVGKAAIHPFQVGQIERQYRVAEEDLEIANRVLAVDAPAVFQVDQIMCEPATHSQWARATVDRARIYGVEGKADSLTTLDRRLVAS
ncbi:HpcH/HpaI aldolase/citrate lyase family protein [Rhodospirillum rubrum]|uniref:ATP/GTP-binding protein n=1 Tax=Rhodospirillum rubrum (strain ATCC 11170 / ATH 1.1.1 / DSM 467 / LMG 4362 / NCIMB 8255 / S1) TaxID=269796 RepID=Q2RVZ6_RHORT|nr:HpcH/HpaI aldolase/citrate lyase family protein [Rhodospirillum rubrum]ABC21699.1 ATP/GTP-binding protein [Rhodospirillum rubrum ATCC 11170]AEO47397.1 ATP/GTP-binding protein [Rhodospirillum rubrum F11]MBK5953252.1 ATP-binding protein [Rhodospirillum rubrum]QXG81361.1 HpcH/HpaI aldolase/citrate lyase family protein [Rhodospirillum rubrum]HAP99560.1 ATP-binding protein [Rhodospirillum rubrum]